MTNQAKRGGAGIRANIMYLVPLAFWFGVLVALVIYFFLTNTPSITQVAFASRDIPSFQLISRVDIQLKPRLTTVPAGAIPSPTTQISKISPTVNSGTGQTGETTTRTVTPITSHPLNATETAARPGTVTEEAAEKYLNRITLSLVDKDTPLEEAELGPALAPGKSYLILVITTAINTNWLNPGDMLDFNVTGGLCASPGPGAAATSTSASLATATLTPTTAAISTTRPASASPSVNLISGCVLRNVVILKSANSGKESLAYLVAIPQNENEVTVLNVVKTTATGISFLPVVQMNNPNS